MQNNCQQYYRLKYYCFIFEESLTKRIFKAPWFSEQFSVVWDCPACCRTLSIPDSQPLGVRSIPTITVTSDSSPLNRPSPPHQPAAPLLGNHILTVLQWKEHYSRQQCQKMCFKHRRKYFHQLKTVTCWFYPLPNILSSAYIFWYGVLRLT